MPAARLIDADNRDLGPFWVERGDWETSPSDSERRGERVLLATAGVEPEA